jgi:UDP-glucose 4-epimerase
MRLCVTGGAGYIGSVVAARLVELGHDVVIVDSLVTGHRNALPSGGRFVCGDIGDRRLLGKVLGAGVDAVLHFAALSVVEESVAHPLDYYSNNIGGSIELLRSMKQHGVNRIVFSSSAAVYGNPERLPIEETAVCRPTTPYGISKTVVESILGSCHSAWGLRHVSLRYFNAGGSTKSHGEHHEKESHLIPIVLDVASGQREKLTIFGNDYDTPDGTCIRDFIHVSDLATAHILAIDAMDRGFSGPVNLGSDRGFSVMEVVEAAERITGRKIPHLIGPRRPGDPPALQASSAKAEQVLGWKRSCSSLDQIIRSAYDWRREHPNGYDH